MNPMGRYAPVTGRLPVATTVLLAVLVALGGVWALTRNPLRSPTGPPYVIVLSNAYRAPYAEVLDTSTGRAVQRLAGPREIRQYTMVAAVPDDHTFVVVAELNDGNGALYRVRLNPGGHVVAITRAGDHELGDSSERVAYGVAVSPDGTRVAWTIDETVGYSGRGGPAPDEIDVATLATGRVQRWTAQPGSATGRPSDLAWSPDGRHLAFYSLNPDPGPPESGLRVLDLRSPGASLTTSRQLRADPGREFGSVRYSPDGSRLYVLEGDRRRFPPHRLVELDSLTGTVHRTVPLPSTPASQGLALCQGAPGAHLILLSTGRTGYRVDAGTGAVATFSHPATEGISC